MNLKKAGGYALAIVCFLSAALAVQYSMERRKYAETNKAIDELFKEAEARNPGATGIESVLSLMQVASEMVSKDIASAPNSSAKRTVAIDRFSAFYYINVVSRSEYCRKHGIEIQKFTNAFRDAHREELAIVKANGVNLESRFREPLYSHALCKAFDRAIEVEMKGNAQFWELSEAESCELINEEGVEVAQAMHISLQLPDVHMAMRL